MFEYMCECLSVSVYLYDCVCQSEGECVCESV